MSERTPTPDPATPDPPDPPNAATINPPDPPAAESMSLAAANRLEALRSLRAGRVILAVGVAAVVTTVLVVSIGRLAGFTKLGDTLSGATWGWLGLCALGQIGVFVGYAGAFRASVAGSGDLIDERTDSGDGDTGERASTGDGDTGSERTGDGASRRGPRVGFWHSLKVALAGFGLTQLVAAGGAAGMAFTFWVLRRLGFSRKNAMVQLIALNTAVYLVFGVLGWLGGALGLVDQSVPLGMSVSWFAGFMALIAVALWFTQPQRVAALACADAKSRPRRALAVGVSAADRVRRCTHTGDGRRLMAWALLYWVGDLVSLWAAVKAFGVTVSLAAILSAYTCGYLAQSVPIPLIATGGVDAATTFTLAAVGVPIEVALLGVVAHRVFAFWLPMFPGLWSVTALVRDERPASTRRGRLLRGVIGGRR